MQICKLFLNQCFEQKSFRVLNPGIKIIGNQNLENHALSLTWQEHIFSFTAAWKIQNARDVSISISYGS